VYNGEARDGEREEVNADPGPNSLSHARRRPRGVVSDRLTSDC
jgi:hypothetical protein